MVINVSKAWHHLFPAGAAQEGDESPRKMNLQESFLGA